MANLLCPSLFSDMNKNKIQLSFILMAHVAHEKHILSFVIGTLLRRGFEN